MGAKTPNILGGENVMFFPKQRGEKEQRPFIGKASFNINRQKPLFSMPRHCAEHTERISPFNPYSNPKRSGIMASIVHMIETRPREVG